MSDASELRKSSISENFSLPPKVFGRTRSYIELVIEAINWKTSKTFSSVKVNVIWWGQSEGICIEGIKIDVNNKAALKSICYQVKTNQRLFQSYLKNSDPVKIDIYSSKTGDFIGAAKLILPASFLNNNCEEQNCKITSSILTSRQFILGEILVCLKTSTVDKMVTKSPVRSLKVKNPMDKKALKEKVTNVEEIQVIGQKKRISFRQAPLKKTSSLIQSKNKENKPSNKSKPASSVVSSVSSDRPSSINSTKKSSLINYLSGNEMSPAQESNILNEVLGSISPSQSVLESLDQAENSPIKQKQSHKINFIRITVPQVDLNSAGQREMMFFMNQTRQQKCLVKCAITSKIFDDRIARSMLSPVFEMAPERITFGKQITEQFKMPQNSNIFVNFGFCLRSIEDHATSFFLGFARIELAEVLSRGSLVKRCPVMSESDVRVGIVTIKLELGIYNLDFGRELIEENFRLQKKTSEISIMNQKTLSLVNQEVQTKSHPSNSNDAACQNDREHENKTVQTDKPASSQQLNNNVGGGFEDRDTEMIDVEKERNLAKSKVYRGLFFIEGLRNVKGGSNEFFISYEGFWNECLESTEVATKECDFIFNHLKQFPIICNDSFLKRVQNNHLELKLWEKTEHSEKLIGSTKIPLHQFYIAFRDVAMIEHLSSNQLPIISIDTFANFISPLTSELCCQGKVLLAIGNECQIEYLKLLRNLNNLQRPVASKSTGTQANDSNSQIKNKLSAFIESLSQKIPESGLTNNFSKAPSTTSSSSSSSLQPQLRKTSDLLDSLQKALAQPPVINHSHISVDSDSSLSSTFNEKVKIQIKIEHATHLPKVVVKKKQNRKKNKNSSTPQKTEFEPSTYATFESCLEHLNENSLPEDVVKSHEGIVHCTRVLKSVDPQWNQSFNARIPLDVLSNPQKRFVVKVWRKVAQDSDMKPSPFDDAIIGFSAVDLSVLLTGLPLLSGFYNIMDFSGKINGQIKLSFKPVENLSQYQDSSMSLPIPTPLTNPLNIDVSSSDDGANLLSRTLKRKFTELDEITQRLKARLFDVTGDENFDPDDEFERDLNTAVDDAEDFAWLQHDQNGDRLNAFLENPQPSTSKSVPDTNSMPSRRQVSGCSSSEAQPMAIDQLMKKYDLDTLINPNIFKNLLDPNLANSDSTPTLNPKPLESIDDSGSGEGDTTVSSILSNDQVQTIQNALENTSLAESYPRKEPEGN